MENANNVVNSFNQFGISMNYASLPAAGWMMAYSAVPEAPKIFRPSPLDVPDRKGMLGNPV